MKAQVLYKYDPEMKEEVWVQSAELLILMNWYIISENKN